MTTKKHPAASAVMPAKKTAAKKVPLKKTVAKKIVKKTSAIEVRGAPALSAKYAAAVEKTLDELTARKEKKKMKKEHKVKVVRDSFTMPQREYKKIAEIKESCLKAGLQVKKSEVLRAGLIALCELGEQQIIQSLDSLAKVRTGRPKKNKS